MFRPFDSLRQIRTTGVALLWAAAWLVRAETPTPSAPPPVRNLILMIGDGMGPRHVRVTSDFSGKPLILQSLPVQGSLTTLAANNAVTDSAAAGTALACGRKTDNGVLGQLPDGTKLVSIAEQARDAGKRVGILTSVPANHATPASFYAHVPSRNSYYDIGLQAFASRFDVLGGTSLSDEQGKNVTPRPGTTLWQEAETAGYRTVRTPLDMKAFAPGKGRLLLVPERLHAESGVPYGRAFDPEKEITLAQMTAKALELLDNPNGFFLMVEGGAIDQAGHANDVVRMVAETLAFDEAVTAAKAFADAHPDTLIVVTADHETGGLTLLDGYVPEAARAVLSKQRSSASKTSDDLKRCVAEAKRADDGTAGWAAARNVLSTALGIKEADCAPLEKDYQAVLKAPDGEAGKALDTLMRDAAKIRDAAAGLAWTTGGHTATDVPLWAFGPGSERFAGVQDNTQVFAHGKALLLPPAP